MSQQAEPGPKPRYHRLLIGFNHHTECRSVLGFAAQVSQAAGVELAGVFVEDQDLLDLARLPFSAEILSSSRQTRNLDFNSIEGELRAIAWQMQRSLRILAERTKRQYSFRTVRGHLLRALIAQVEAGDLVLLRTACVPWPSTKPAMSIIGDIRGPVVLLEPPGSGNGNLVALAQEIARIMKQELVVLREYSGPQTLRSLNAGLIIAPAALLSADAAGNGVEHFVDAAPCPVLLVPETG